MSKSRRTLSNPSATEPTPASISTKILYYFLGGAIFIIPWLFNWGLQYSLAKEMVFNIKYVIAFTGYAVQYLVIFLFIGGLDLHLKSPYIRRNNIHWGPVEIAIVGISGALFGVLSGASIALIPWVLPIPITVNTFILPIGLAMVVLFGIPGAVGVGILGPIIQDAVCGSLAIWTVGTVAFHAFTYYLIIRMIRDPGTLKENFHKFFFVLVAFLNYRTIWPANALELGVWFKLWPADFFLWGNLTAVGLWNPYMFMTGEILSQVVKLIETPILIALLYSVVKRSGLLGIQRHWQKEV